MRPLPHASPAVALLAIGMLTAGPCLPSHAESAVLAIPRLDGPIDLDGLSDEEAWRDIAPLPMTMRAPTFGAAPSERTEILLGHDGDFLYVAGRLFDRDPSGIQVPSLRRDVWTYGCDAVGIIIDTFNDKQNAVGFITTPGGTRTDIDFLNDADGAPGNNINLSWNTFWDVASARTEQGWFVEMKIPFSSLRYQVVDGRVTMGLLAYRWLPREFELDTFPSIPEDLGFWAFVQPSQGQEMTFTGIESHNPLYVSPYVLGGVEQAFELQESAGEYRRDDRFTAEAGLDLKYGLTDNLTFDATINPDFAQVEADDQQINLTRFSLFFPEKRPFFQERSGSFDFAFDGSNRLFHSRRIGLHEGEQILIYGGARLVGRIGPWDLGLLTMQAEPESDLEAENSSVLRFRRQVINDYSYVGGMTTLRLGAGGAYRAAYGLDAVIRPLPDNYVTVRWAQTAEDGTASRLGSLDPSRIYLAWDRRTMVGPGLNLTFSRAGSAYDPGLGHEQRQDYTRIGDRLQYGWQTQDISRIQNHQLFIAGSWIVDNAAKDLVSSEVGPGWRFETRSGSSGELSLLRSSELVTELFSLSDDADVPAGQYTFRSLQADFSTPRGSLRGASAEAVVGSFYDGRQISLGVSPWLNLWSQLQISGMYRYDGITFSKRDQELRGHTSRLKLAATLTTSHSAAALMQYSSAIDAVIVNVRFRYNPREGTDFHLVYDEGLNTDRRRQSPALPISSQRTVMVKYARTFGL